MCVCVCVCVCMCRGSYSTWCFCSLSRWQPNHFMLMALLTYNFCILFHMKTGDSSPSLPTLNTFEYSNKNKQKKGTPQESFCLPLPPGLLWCYHGLPGAGCVLVCPAHTCEVQGLELRYLGENVLVVALGGFYGIAVEGQGDELGKARQLVYLLQLHDVVTVEIKHHEVG